MAAVRPLGGSKAKTADTALAAVPPPLSLHERLAEAQRAADEPSRRASELDAALRDALAREDFTAARTLKDELSEARQEAAIATAAVTGLQTAIAEIDRMKAEDDRVIQEQQQKADARVRQEAARQRELELDDELDADIAAVFTGLEAVMRTYGHALQLETQIGQVRAEQIQAGVILGDAPRGLRGLAPNKASVLQDSYAVLRELMKWTGPERRTPPQVFVAEAAGGRGRTQQAPW